MNNKPIEVDFNNMDVDGGVRLHLPSIKKQLEECGLELIDGKIIWVTDGEIEAKGHVVFRDGIWVLIPDKDGFTPVDITSPYHI